MARKIAIVFSVVFTVAVTSVIYHYTQTFGKVLLKGEMYFKSGRYRLSLPYFISAFNKNKKDLRPVYYLLNIYENIGNKNKVKDMLEYLIKMKPDDIKTRRYLADTYYSLGDYAKAEALYKKILSSRGDAEIKLKLAEVLAWQKKYKEAVIMIRGILNDNPSDLKLTEFLADIYMWNKNYIQAQAFYEKILSAQKDNKRVILKLADVLRYQGKDKEALEVYGRY